MTVTLSHKIELKANNKFKTYCRKAFGVSRFTWNWALERVNDKRERKEKIDVLELKKEFNHVKRRQYPFVMEVTKYASQQPFIFLKRALSQFFEDLKSDKSPSKRKGFPVFKKKRYSSGSFYIGGDLAVVKKGSEIKDKRFGASDNKPYLHIPKFGWVMLREEIRFPGKINSVTISQDGDKFFASFSIETSEIVYEGTHKENVQEALCGCDWGVKDLLTLSNGIKIKGSKHLKRRQRQLARQQRKLAKKQHPRTKGDKTPKSKNYIKQSRKVGKLYRKIKAHIHKNPSRYGDKLMRISDAYVIQVQEEEIEEGHYLTWLNLIDGEEQQYSVYYNGELDDVFEDDTVEVTGLPLGTSSFENTEGGDTLVVVLAGCRVNNID